ncbi:hypothetical protein DFH09DRAFT_1159244 [Mycena vulgaris]|nr:hypothetical protein DFH09DRAFT_1159244 [Mycena vulgaris]
MAETVFSIQELCNHLARHIACHKTSYRDLKSAALVCHTLCISAQSQLFRDVIITSTRFSYNAEDAALEMGSPATATERARELRARTVRRALEAPVAAALRLSAILTASPHLTLYPRQLTICPAAPVVKSLSSIRFPCLQRIRFDFDMGTIDADVLHITRDFIDLPAIREVEIIHLSMREGIPVDLFRVLFETCTNQLDSLALVYATFPSALPAISVPRAGGRNIQIKKLRLIASEGLEEWLMSPSSPFDFTHLVDVDIHSTRIASLFEALASAHSSITRLSIRNTSAFPIDLSEFPVLTSLEIDQTNVELISSLKPDNCVERLVLLTEFYGFFMGEHPGSSWAATDTLVANSPMPALRQLELRIHGPYRFGSEVAKLYFPQLEAKGLLIVAEHREEYA